MDSGHGKVRAGLPSCNSRQPEEVLQSVPMRPAKLGRVSERSYANPSAEAQGDLELSYLVEAGV